MSSQRAQTQLSKQLALNAPNIVAPPAPPIPNVMPNAPVQLTFPAYDTHYNTLSIPPRPANGQGSHHTYQNVTWSNLHPVLFQLEPYPNTVIPPDPPALMNPHIGQQEVGNIVSGQVQRLRYFSHLPRWIPHDVSGLLMELWVRLDPRVRMNDIIARINLPPGMSPPNPSTLHMRRTRFRDSIRTLIWLGGRPNPQSADIEIINGQTCEQILLNTSMIVDRVNSRMLKPVLDQNRVTLGYVDSGLPLDYFLVGFPGQVTIPSDRQIVAIELRKRLQTLAIVRGCGYAPESYKQLPIQSQPPWIHHDSAEGRQISELDNKSHREWMREMCLQYPGLTRDLVQRNTAGQTASATAHPVQPTTAHPPVAPPAPLPPTLAPATVTAVAPTLAPAPPTTTTSVPAARIITDIDHHLTGPNVGSAGSPVPPRHYGNGNGGVSYYVKDVHRQGRRQL